MTTDATRGEREVVHAIEREDATGAPGLRDPQIHAGAPRGRGTDTTAETATDGQRGQERTNLGIAGHPAATIATKAAASALIATGIGIGTDDTAEEKRRTKAARASKS
jgi:hypothetical protein